MALFAPLQKQTKKGDSLSIGFVYLSIMILNKAKFDAEDFGDEIVLLELATGAYWSIKGGLIGAVRGLLAGGSTQELSAWWSEVVGDPEEDVSSVSVIQKLVERLESRGLIEGGEPVPEAWSGIEITSGPAEFVVHEELSDLVKLDPIHDVSDAGWPHKSDDATSAKAEDT